MELVTSPGNNSNEEWISQSHQDRPFFTPFFYVPPPQLTCENTGLEETFYVFRSGPLEQFFPSVVIVSCSFNRRKNILN